MSHDRRKPYFARDRPGPERERDWDRGRGDYRGDPRDIRVRDMRDVRDVRDMRDRRSSGLPPMKRSRSRTREIEKRHSRSPRKSDKDMIDDNILSEISKLPEPSELWDGNQYQEGGGYSGAPMSSSGFPREPSSSNYAPNYQPPQYAGIYDDFPPLASAHQPPGPVMEMWNNMALPPPPAPYHNPEDQLKKEAAIETEMRHQKAALSKQREDYIKKTAILKKELDTLKDQRNELRGDAKRSPSPDTKRFLKENTKLQLEIQNKLKTINNVVDMLNGIIGEEAQEVPEVEDSPDRKRKSRSPSNKKFNYVYYDPEMHWCRVCNEFPPTAKDYLNHLHSAAHHKMAAQHMEAPWHSVTGMNEGFVSFPSAPTKRTPIRGLQFFVPSTAWYCKLCDQFIGDLHCASAHLKSVTHSKNYTNFVEQNPHWETDWMSDRQKAFEKARNTNKGKVADKPQQYAAHTITFSKDGFHTKRPKTSPSPTQEVKKKKEKKKKNKRKRETSSSSTSQSDSSDSEHSNKKKAKAKKKEPDAKEKALEQWMSNIKCPDRLSEDDRKLWDKIQSRMKKERESPQRSTSRERERIVEMQRKIRESERRASHTREIRDPRAPREPRSRDRYDRARDKRDEPAATKPDVKKMPFIGKMPVYKHLGKTKNDEQKKEEQKKKDEEDSAKKRQEQDAEIQRKVAEFKDKIAKSQEEKEKQLRAELAPPGLALPLPGLIHTAHPPPLMSIPTTCPTPTLPKDFQEALDIIFPTDPKTTEKLSADLFNAMQQPGILGMPPMPGLMPPFNPLGLMQPPGMFPFDMNSGLFPQPQLYDSHVPIMPKTRPKRRNNNNNSNNQNNGKKDAKADTKTQVKKEQNGNAEAKKKEELDDLAMLGIDASDVGAGI